LSFALSSQECISYYRLLSFFVLHKIFFWKIQYWIECLVSFAFLESRQWLVAMPQINQDLEGPVLCPRKKMGTSVIIRYLPEGSEIQNQVSNNNTSLPRNDAPSFTSYGHNNNHK
jgi:hypothetical protein